MVHEVSSLHSLFRRKTPRPSLQISLHNILVPHNSGHLTALESYAEVTLKQVFRENPSIKQFSLYWKRDDQNFRSTLTYKLWLTIWLESQGFGRNMIEKLLTTKIGKRYGNIYISKGMLRKEQQKQTRILIIRWTKWTAPWLSASLSPSHLLFWRAHK